jgi:hypothetical protein
MEKTHDFIKYLDLSNTAVTLSDVKPVLIRSLDLEVLEISGLEGLTDIALSRLLDDFYGDLSNVVPPTTAGPLAKLRSLALRHTLVSGAALAKLIPHLSRLEEIDVSFVPIGTMPLEATGSIPPLTKLSLTSTPIDAQRLLPILEHLPALKTLNIAALGASAKTARGFAIGGASTGAMGSRTLTDAVLVNMTEILRTMPHLESVSLAGNAGLGLGKEKGVSYFIRYIGRRLKSLNLGGIPQLRSEDLQGLLGLETTDECALERLVLRGCNVGDQAAPFMACPYLHFLDLENTKFSGKLVYPFTWPGFNPLLTEEGLLEIIDACPRLETLNLTSCRGVRLHDRRRFFEVWHERRADVQEEPEIPPK